VQLKRLDKISRIFHRNWITTCTFCHDVVLLFSTLSWLSQKIDPRKHNIQKLSQQKDSTMRLQVFLFLAMVAQPAATQSLKGAPINRDLELFIPDDEVTKIIGGQPAQPGEFPYFVDIDSKWFCIDR
jgi:hypothetical protein